MSATDSGSRSVGERRRRGHAGRGPRRGRPIVRLSGIEEALQSDEASALARAARQLSRLLQCAVAITRREGCDGATIVANERPAEFENPLEPLFLRRIAERFASRSRALSLIGNDQGDTDGLPPGHHYLGLPAPRGIGAQHALHLLRASPFSETQRRVARIAADRIGAWATGASAVMSWPADGPDAASSGPAPEAGGVAIEQLLSDAMRAAAETLSADTCSLMVMDEAEGSLVVDTAYGLADGIVRDPGRRPGEGIAGYVMSLGQPVILNDPLQDPRLQGIAIEPRPHIRCSICVPIELREGLRGVVSFNRTENAEPFTQDDLRLACTVASQLGPCVANARLYQQAAARLGEMTAISRMAEYVTPAMDVQRVAELLATSIAQAVGIARCRLYLGQAEDLKLVAWPAYPPDPDRPHETATEKAALRQAAAQLRPVVIAAREPGPDRGGDGAKPSRKPIAALPIMCGGRCLGVFCADLEDNPSLAELNLGLLERVLARAGVALDNAATHQRLRENVDDFYRLYDSVQRLNTGFDPHEVLKQTAHEVKLLTGCRRVGLVPLSPALEALSAQGERSASILRLAPESAAMRAAQSVTTPLLVSGEESATSAEMTELASQVRRFASNGFALVIPLAHEQGSLGLVVGWRFAREPRKREISLAAGLCAHGAALLRKAIDYEAAINKRSLELSALYRLCEEISAATSFEAALRSVLEIAHSMVDCDEGLVFIWSAESGRLELAASRGVDFEAIKEQAPQAQPGNMYQWVFTEGKAFISTDIGQFGGDGSPGGQVLRSAMAVPLVVGNAAIGVLAIHSARPRAYTEEHVKVFSIVASQAAAIYRALQSLGSLSRYTDNILQSIVAGVIGLDRTGRIVIWSPAAERIFNRTARDAVGASLVSLGREIGREQGSCVERPVESLALVARRVLAHGEPVLEQELRLERDGAPPRTLLAECTPLRGADAELVGAVLLVEDITERKRMQDRMRQMSQLAAVGHLAANVAHEIRNPLSAIKTAAQFLSTEYAADGLIAQFSGIINEECDRLGKVATDFLTYARPNEPALERISLAAVVGGALAATAAETAQRSISINWRAPRALPKVWGDAEALRQVLVNLILNAAQAIGSDGEITVTLGATGAGADGRALEAVVSDTGPGIAEENIERIWTPFFSTRAKGTGLGLSIVRKTVEAHGGQVWAEGGRSGGAAFRMRLPLDGGTRARQAGACAPASIRSGRQWRQLDLFAEYSAQPDDGDQMARAAR